MSHEIWMNHQFNQQHREELIREAENRRLVTIAVEGKTQVTLQTLIYQVGRSLVLTGQRLQSSDMNAVLKQN